MEDMRFPIQGASECPYCGSTERIGQQYIQELKRKGKLTDKLFTPETLSLQIPLFDPTVRVLATNFTIPVLVIRFDICAEEDCHCIYCTGIDVVFQPAQLQQIPNALPFKV